MANADNYIPIKKTAQQIISLQIFELLFTISKYLTAEIQLFVSLSFLKDLPNHSCLN